MPTLVDTSIGREQGSQALPVLMIYAIAVLGFQLLILLDRCEIVECRLVVA